MNSIWQNNFNHFSQGKTPKNMIAENKGIKKNIF